LRVVKYNVVRVGYILYRVTCIRLVCKTYPCQIVQCLTFYSIAIVCVMTDTSPLFQPLRQYLVTLSALNGRKRKSSSVWLIPHLSNLELHVTICIFVFIY
jgi:hypothetical protein